MNEFTTRKSKGILAIYWGGLIFLVVLLTGTSRWSQDDMSPLETNVFYAVFAVVIVFFIYLLYRIYHMRYLIKNGEITIHGAFNNNVVKISDITEIKKTAIPTGIRLWGGSFMGGLYYLPGIGKAWVAMTNFEDGVLITTRNKKHYVVTPQNPDQFIDTVKTS